MGEVIMMREWLRELTCPVCGAPEVKEEGILNIRGNKVYDKHGGWSQCLCDHGIQNIDGKEVAVGTLWFVECSEVNGRTMVQIDGNPKLYIWESQR